MKTNRKTEVEYQLQTVGKNIFGGEVISVKGAYRSLSEAEKAADYYRRARPLTKIRIVSVVAVKTKS
jgi:hypothetical protein